MPWTNVSQGEAALACLGVGNGYHLISENEWLTIADNITRVIDNDCDISTDGLQLATGQGGSASDCTASGTIAHKLTNGASIYGFAGGVSEWTDQTMTAAGLPATSATSTWTEYFDVLDYQGLNIAPAYYYSSQNGIGRLKVGQGEGSPLRAFIRGASAIYDLDCSYSPATATSPASSCSEASPRSSVSSASGAAPP